MSWYKMAKHGVKYDYSSTQVNFPKDISKEIVDWGKANIKEEDLYTDPEDPSLGRENEIHVTVKYGIHTTDIDEIKEILKDEEEVELTLDKISKFTTNDDYDVIKIDVESKDLKKLNKLIAENTKVTDTFPNYKPHLTIAYVKKGKCEGLVGNKTFDGKSLTIDEITFSCKDGTKKKIKLNSKDKK